MGTQLLRTRSRFATKASAVEAFDKIRAKAAIDNFMVSPTVNNESTFGDEAAYWLKEKEASHS